MNRYVAITLLIVISSDSYHSNAHPPLHLTVDCECDNDFATTIEEALPKSVKDGHFVIEKLKPREMEKSASDTALFEFLPNHDEAPKFGLKPRKLNPIEAPKLSISKLFSDEDRPKPTRRFRPYRFRPPKVRTPHFQVPKLKPVQDRAAKPPTLGSALIVPFPRRTFERDQEVSSAEKIEFIKKGVQKMIKFVQVLGQIDQYISDRARIVIEKLSKTFVEE